MSQPLYTLSTWDTEQQQFTPALELGVPCENVTRMQLRTAIRQARRVGYDSNGYFIERTDGAGAAPYGNSDERDHVL